MWSPTECVPVLTARASQRPAHELRGRSIAMGLIGPIAIRPRQFDALVGWPREMRGRSRAERAGGTKRCRDTGNRLRELGWRRVENLRRRPRTTERARVARDRDRVRHIQASTEAPFR